MEGPWAAYLAALAAAGGFWLISAYLFGRKPKLPPGPKPWPIIGNLNLIGPLPHHSIHQLAQKYGPIMLLRFGSVPVVVGSSVEMAKVFLHSMDNNFACRPQTAAGKHTHYDRSGITWSPYGPYLQQVRKLYQTELFSPRRLRVYEHVLVEEVRRYMRRVYERPGKAFELREGLTTVSLNAICRMVVGTRFEDLAGGSVGSAGEFKGLVDELSQLNGALNIGDWIPCLSSLDLQGYVKRMKAVSSKLDGLYERVLDQHSPGRKGAAADGCDMVQDMVDLLLQVSQDSNQEIKLERHQLKALTQELLIAGTESSTTTVEWAVSELLKKAETLEKATEELDRVIGRNRWVEEKDMPNLPFMEAIVKETMRLHPVAPLLVPRLAREDCKVGGYDVPKGSRVMVSVYTIGRDPSVWGDKPTEFCPDRFMGKDIDVKGEHFELLPFGAGSRMCVGHTLGLKFIQATLANLLHGFNWKLPNNMKPEDLNMEEIFGLSSLKKFPIHVVAEPRLPPHLY